MLISHLLANTKHIRVGSGGIMLQHYSPYKVAENFNVLASLAPGRVDLGIGRGPGGLPRSTRALQQDFGSESRNFRDKLIDLELLLSNTLSQDHPLYGVQAQPIPPQPAGLFLLGTTPDSAEMAAELGMPYVFALFLNSDESVMYQAVGAYQRAFDAGKGRQPETMLALPIIVADTDDEAAQLAAEIKVVRIRLESGRTFSVTSVEAAEEFGRQAQEPLTYEVLEANVVNGSLETVTQRIHKIQRRCGVAEIIAVTYIQDFEKRLHSYEMLSSLIK